MVSSVVFNKCGRLKSVDWMSEGGRGPWESSSQGMLFAISGSKGGGSKSTSRAPRVAQLGQVAAELKRVAEALLGVNEKAFACRILTLPGRWKAGPRGGVLRSPAPLISRKPFKKPAAPKLAQRQIRLGVRVIGI